MNHFLGVHRLHSLTAEVVLGQALDQTALAHTAIAQKDHFEEDVRRQIIVGGRGAGQGCAGPASGLVA